MDKTFSTFKIIYVAPAVVFGLFFIYSLFSRLTGIASFTVELFDVFLDTLFYFLLFLITGILAITSKVAIYKRILFLALILVMTYVFVVWQSPQERVTRFYAEIQNHKMLNSLKTSDVSSVEVDNIVFTQPEQISPIIETLNNSTWYTPNHECRGREIEMIVILHTGEVVRLQISRFCNEDTAALLFIRPFASGFASGGNAYAPKLPSILESLGYPLSSDH